jgi:hypothetical protein
MRGGKPPRLATGCLSGLSINVSNEDVMLIKGIRTSYVIMVMSKDKRAG